MRKGIVWLLIAVLCLGVCLPALGEAAEEERIQEDVPAKYVQLKRGKTLNLWAWGFSDEGMLYAWNSGKEEVPILGVKLKGVQGTPTVKVTKGGDWLSAEVKGKRVLLTVYGSNTRSSTKSAVVKVKDDRGTFGKINITRGGMVRFTAIQQRGETIRLKLNRCKGVTTYATVRRVVWNTLGQEVQALGSLSVTRIQPGTGSVTYVDSQLPMLRAGYTYGYTVSYISPASNRSLRTSAACINLDRVYGWQKGHVATTGTYLNYYDDAWLYSLGQE